MTNLQDMNRRLKAKGWTFGGTVTRHGTFYDERFAQYMDDDEHILRISLGAEPTWISLMLIAIITIIGVSIGLYLN